MKKKLCDLTLSEIKTMCEQQTIGCDNCPLFDKKNSQNFPYFEEGICYMTHMLCYYDDFYERFDATPPENWHFADIEVEVEEK